MQLAKSFSCLATQGDQHGTALASGLALLASEGSSELGEGSLVVAHAHSEGLEVVELVGETHSTAVEEHPVTGVVGHLVHLEDTLAEHGHSSLRRRYLPRPIGQRARTAL